MPGTTRRCLLAAPALLAGAARADPNFPARPLTWIVPFAAGGITDTSARMATPCSMAARGRSPRRRPCCATFATTRCATWRR
jgi:tripartite-type tricarboxylate transporter receptor subunit TctC